MTYKKIALLSGLIPLFAICSTNAIAASGNQISKEHIHSLYKTSFPTANVDEIDGILNESRQKEITNVMNCVRNLNGYAGLEIRHEPDYLIAVKFTKHASRKLKKCTNNSIFIGVTAPLGQPQLKDIETQIHSALSRLHFDYSTRVSIRRNRIILKVRKENLFEAKHTVLALGIPRRTVRFKAVKKINSVPTSLIQANQKIKASPESSNNLDGPGGPCTTGFNVVHVGTVTHPATAKKGVTTAGHCEDKNAKVVSLTHDFMGESAPDTTHVNSQTTASGNHRRPGVDLQWHHKAGAAYDAELSITNINPGFALVVYDTDNSNTLPLGTVMMAIGRSGGNTEPNALKIGMTDGTETQTTLGMTHVWARAKQSILDATAPDSFTQAGDSGGPVFRLQFYDSVPTGVLGASALGGIRGHLGTEHGVLIYTPTEKFAELGLQIITQTPPPPACSPFDPFDPSCW